ncbi:hypothetical protein LCY76_01275 [Fictibacillus sp. KIGAM418]|uniref:Uncharacterized protein n=1 Tax=Fictibacillus marinisediminis TaxID=2878389 RepID=A0A9X1X6Z0_9BACL|nr:hypothetical protein [Fictibacillus marinisediminis]MCK6255277.1 hypothetical protein [Fictibacillus marinisediminis]
MAKMYTLSAQESDIQELLYVSNDPGSAGKPSASELDDSTPYTDVFMDNKKNYWFAKAEDTKNKRHTIYIFDHKNGRLISHKVNGRPNFYEFDDSVVIACEGDGSKGSLLIFSKEQPKLIKEWKVNGYLWEVEKNQGAIYVSCYIVEEDQAVLYVIKDNKKKRVNLGKNMAPTDILCIKDEVYISAAPILNGDPKKIIVLNSKEKVVREYPLSISPRTLYHVEDEIMVYELDLATGKTEKIVYVNLNTGEQFTHAIPNSQVVECTSRSLSLLQQDSKTLFTWDHTNRKIVESRKIS